MAHPKNVKNKPKSYSNLDNSILRTVSIRCPTTEISRYLFKQALKSVGTYLNMYLNQQFSLSVPPRRFEADDDRTNNELANEYDRKAFC